MIYPLPTIASLRRRERRWYILEQIGLSLAIAAVLICVVMGGCWLVDRQIENHGHLLYQSNDSGSPPAARAEADAPSARGGGPE